jgi:hypothetical protein
MTIDAARLYELLPAIYRIRDEEHAGALKALIGVLAEQAAVLEESLAQLYDDQFIETCAPWVVPYIGDLIGYRPLHARVARVGGARAEVAHTLAFRRRKGTAAMLEQLARDVTGWDAHVVEYFQLLATTQYMNHVRRRAVAWADLRDWERLERAGTAFDRLAHTVDIRRIDQRRGKHNISNIGLFLWRLSACALTRSPAVRVGGDATRYVFHPAGLSVPLFTKPALETTISHLSTPLDVPLPISRRVLHERLDAYYGPGKSLFIELAAVRSDGSIDPTKKPVAVDIKDVHACNLGDLVDDQGNAVLGADGLPVWAHTPVTRIAIDPELGRLAFPADPATAVLVTWHYGFSADTGGGEYERAATFDRELKPVVVVSAPQSIQNAIDGLNGAGVVEVHDSGRYSEALSVKAAEAGRVEVRASNGHRPTIVLGGELRIEGAVNSEVTLNGLFIIGGPIKITGDVERVNIRHCTLVPGSARDATQQVLPSVRVESRGVTLSIERSIVGAIELPLGAVATISDSIVDATAETKLAYSGPEGAYGGELTLADTTVFGRVRATQMRLATNSIVLAAVEEAAPSGTLPVDVDRRQEGCVRFSFVPIGSRTPRRFSCRPANSAEATRVRPQFTSIRYGDPGYGQLGRRVALEILEGADDEAEMGAFHDLGQPQRETNLRVRLDEYLRFGLDAGIFYAS